MGLMSKDLINSLYLSPFGKKNNWHDISANGSRGGIVPFRVVIVGHGMWGGRLKKKGRLLP